MDALAELQAENGARVWNILQLRLHPSIIALKEKVGFINRLPIYRRSCHIFNVPVQWGQWICELV
jgi:hypothetical protein